MKNNPTLTDVEMLPVYTDNIPETFEIQFTSQKAWETKDLYAFLAGALGTGVYIVSQFLNFIPGLILGFLFVMVGKNLGHLISSTRRNNTFRAFSNINRSWISRGATCILAFGLFGGLDILARLEWIKVGSGGAMVFSILAFILALVIMVYPGLLLAGSRAIPLWNTPLIPIILTTYALAMGISLIAILAPISGMEDQFHAIPKIQLILVSAVLFFIMIHLMVIQYSNKAAKQSAYLLLKGELKTMFVNGVLIAGLIVPLFITGLIQVTGSRGLFGIFVAGVLTIAGGFLYEIVLFKAAVFKPLSDIG